MNYPLVDVIIPAFNEEKAIANVIKEIPDFVREIIVVNNNSNDHTQQVAQNGGATVLFEKRSGYGHACLKGIEYLNQKTLKPEIVVFLDGDYSDFPQEMGKLIHPIIEDDIDFVIGARKKELRAKGSLTPQQAFGNRLATKLMNILYGANFTDLGPFRAIKFEKLLALQMQDKTYGWTVEMQLKALKHQLSYTEVGVPYRNRIGTSKISGTVKGSIMAGIKILGWIAKYGFSK